MTVVNTYWSIMNGEAVGGRLVGTKLTMLPVGNKMRWKDWAQKHPDTLVLSIKGVEDGYNPYINYFISKEGFRGATVQDTRMETKILMN